MQRIERYGVIALVFLLVTIVAVSLWGERKKTDGWFSFLDRDSKASRVDELLADASAADVGGEPVGQRSLVHEGLPLSEGEWTGVDQRAFGGPEPAPVEFRDQPVDATGSVIPPEVLPANELAAYQGTPPPQAPVVPAAAPAREYTIRGGDTLSEIAQRELGTKNRWRELVELNPGLDPAKLLVGTRIRLTAAVAPATASAPRPEPKTAPQPKVAAAAGGNTAARPAGSARSYTVRSGDTLSQIAQRELGTTSRWRELVELNPGLDPAKLLVGTTIRLPGGAQQPQTRVARADSSPKAPAAAPQKGSKVR
jgi:LysM repeat protein